MVLLAVPDAELRPRDRIRPADEGWTDIKWFDCHQSVISDRLERRLVDHVIDGDRPPVDVAAVVADLTTAATDVTTSPEGSIQRVDRTVA